MMQMVTNNIVIVVLLRRAGERLVCGLLMLIRLFLLITWVISLELFEDHKHHILLLNDNLLVLQEQRLHHLLIAVLCPVSVATAKFLLGAGLQSTNS